MKDILLETIKRIRAKLDKAKQLECVTSTLSELDYLENRISDDHTVIGNVWTPHHINGRIVGLTEPIQPLETYSDDALVAEVRRRMNNGSGAARA